MLMNLLSDRVVRSLTTVTAITVMSVAATLTFRGSVLADPPAKKPGKSAKPTRPAATTTAIHGDNTPLTEEQKIVHVLNRMAFGPRPGDVERVKAIGLSRYIEQQLTPEKIADTAVEA